MELGIHIINFDWAGGPADIGPELARAAKASESIGANGLSLMDHYFQMEHRWKAEQPMLEGYTGLGFMAAHTRRIRLSLVVTGVTYRHPGLLAKIIATLDVLSGGRAELGIGAAWYQREHLALGVPFPSTAERFERLEEALQICLQMWSDDVGPYSGKHYQLAETLCSPMPLSKPRPPIMIGGAGERKTLRMVAQYADSCNLFGMPVDQVQHKLDVLRGHCDTLGRDYDAIVKTMMYFGASVENGDHARFLAEMEAYAAIGIDQVILVPAGPTPARWIEEKCGPLTAPLAEIKTTR